VRRAIAIALLVLVPVGALGPVPVTAAPPEIREETIVTREEGVSPDEKYGEVASWYEPLGGLGMVLREIQIDPSSEAGASATVHPLSEERARELLQRADPIDTGETVPEPFAVRQGPRPRSQEAERIVLAADSHRSASVPEVERGTDVLEVVRYAPEGDAGRPFQVSIVFSQPMVALSAVEGTDADGFARIEPEMPGRWQWLGNRTLVFEPEGDFTPATTFDVTVPAGTRSASGGALAEALEFGFETAPIGVLYTTLEDVLQRLQPVVFVAFDRKVDREQILAQMRLEGGISRRLRLLTDEENDEVGDQYVDWFDERYGAGSWLAVRPAEPLEPNTGYSFVLGDGAGGAEQERFEPSSFPFRTYGPLRLTGHGCDSGWSSDDLTEECDGSDRWVAEFANPLERDQGSAISVTPADPEMTVETGWKGVEVRGVREAGVRYTVTIPPGLKDVHGQTLGEAVQLEFTFDSVRDRSTAQLFLPGTAMVVADPTAPPCYEFSSTDLESVRVRIHRSDDPAGDLTAWVEDYLATYDPEEPEHPRPGTLVSDEVHTLAGDEGERVETRIDLQPYLIDGHGQFILWFEPGRALGGFHFSSRRSVWVQVTDIGLTALESGGELLVWATGLTDGAPLQDVDLQLLPAGTSHSRTDAEGLARLEMSTNAEDQRWVLALRGPDKALLDSGDPVSLYESAKSWRASTWDGRSYRWYIDDPRGLYRPGETARVKGWIRDVEQSAAGFDPWAAAPPPTLDWRLYEPSWRAVHEPYSTVVIAEGTTAVDELGGFDIAADLPDDVSHGYAHLEVSVPGEPETSTADRRHAFEVEEYRKPRFTVGISPSHDTSMAGEELVFDIRTTLLTGGGLAGAELSGYVDASVASFRPPGHDEFRFGPWTPWWSGSVRGGFGGRYFYDGIADGRGEYRLGVEFASSNPPRPWLVGGAVYARDQARQRWTAYSDPVLVHPAELYVGLRSASSLVRAGEPFDVEALVVDLRGEVVHDADVRMTLVQQKGWSVVDGHHVMEEADVGECSLIAGAASRSCRFEVDEAGRYRVVARIADAANRPNQTDLYLWIAEADDDGGGTGRWSRLAVEGLELVPGTQDVQPGDTLELLVRSPVYPSTGLLTTSIHGIVLRTELFRMDGPTATLRIPIVEAHVPLVQIGVFVVAAEGGGSAGGPGRAEPRWPSSRKAAVNLSVPPLDRALEVSVEPDAADLQPGDETPLRVRVADSSGAPVQGAQVTLAVVDEAILQLSDHEWLDPLWFFYEPAYGHWLDYRHQFVGPYPGVWTGRDLRNTVLLATPPQGQADGPGNAEQTLRGTGRHPRYRPWDWVAGDPFSNMSRDIPPGVPRPIPSRKDFGPLALFEPAVLTDADGRAVVPLHAPGSLTRYRITALAATRDQFGLAESSITARRPLMVRPSPPRFLNVGDRCELPLLVENRTDLSLNVELAVQALNADLGNDDGYSSDPVGRELVLPPRTQVEVRIPVASRLPGQARFQVVASSDDFTDAVVFDVPVWTPAAAEEVAVYGTLEAGAVAVPVRAPPDVWTEAGGLQVDLYASRLQGLADAGHYLERYVPSCSEQVASRILAQLALGDTFGPTGDGSATQRRDRRRAIEADLFLLEGRQSHDGGFYTWHSSRRASPFVSVHVIHALVLARTAGFQIRDEVMDEADVYLGGLAANLDEGYPVDAARSIRAYALYVRHLMGDDDVDAARTLVAEADDGQLPLEAQGWLLRVLAAGGTEADTVPLERSIAASVTETAAGAHFVTSYGPGDPLLLHSDHRADAVILAALLEVGSHDDLVAKLAHELLANRSDGHWTNTLETALAVVALARYAEVHESRRPRVDAEVWLGDAYAGRHSFRTRDAPPSRIHVPMDHLANLDGGRDLVLSRKGRGPLYYRVGLDYVPRSPDLPALDRGFVLQRHYQAVDDPDDVWRDDQGAWHIRAGARVEVVVTVQVSDERHHVSIVDPLPAGLEFASDTVAGNQFLSDSADLHAPGWHAFLDHYMTMDRRDERTDVFASLLREGIHTLRYEVQATTPGEFVAPPTRAEEMYHPETFGRSATDRVMVE